jgi:hypothetical protein
MDFHYRSDIANGQIDVHELSALRNGDTIVQTNAEIAIANVISNPLSCRNIRSILDGDLALSVNDEGRPLHSLTLRNAVSGGIHNIDKLEEAIGTSQSNLVGIVGNVKRQSLRIVVLGAEDASSTSGVGPVRVVDADLAILGGYIGAIEVLVVAIGLLLAFSPLEPE